MISKVTFSLGLFVYMIFVHLLNLCKMIFPPWSFLMKKLLKYLHLFISSLLFFAVWGTFYHLLVKSLMSHPFISGGGDEIRTLSMLGMCPSAELHPSAPSFICGFN